MEVYNLPREMYRMVLNDSSVLPYTIQRKINLPLGFVWWKKVCDTANTCLMEKYVFEDYERRHPRQSQFKTIYLEMPSERFRKKISREG